MPITVLHFGVLAPLNTSAKTKVSMLSFILVNLWIDHQAITNWFSGVPLPGHEDVLHSFVGAGIVAVLIAMLGVRSWRWVLGAALGAATHIVLDSLVHPEMQPLAPMMEGNPFYMDLMQPLSIGLAILVVWLTAQIVSGSLAYARKRSGRSSAQTAKMST